MKTETIVVLALIAAMIVLMLAAGGVGIWMMNTRAPTPPVVVSGTTTAVPAPPRATDAVTEDASVQAPATPADALFVTARQRMEAGDWTGFDKALLKTVDLGDDEAVRRLYELVARHRHWEQAAAAIRNAIELDEQDHWHWYMLGVATLAQGDDDAYAQACKGMIERFGDRPDPDEQPMIAERIAKMCLLKPAALDEATVRRAHELAAHAVAIGRERRDGLTPWFEMTAALSAHHRGDHEAALTHADAALKGEPYYLIVGGHCLRAIALHKLGRTDEAKAALNDADILLQQVVAPDAEGPISGGWNDWVMTWHLREAARKVTALQDQDQSK
jgi:tetratricopeptide (TPR) repeat protein